MCGLWRYYWHMRFLPLLLILFSCAAARPQTPPVVADFFVDNVGKSYRLLTDDRFVTDNPLGQNTFDFYDSSLGAPTSVDVSSPFAILLFYADYGTIVVLDRTLSEVSRIDLFSLDAVETPAAVARASDQGFWVFDSWDYRLKSLDEQGRIRQQSNDLRLEIKSAAVPDAVYVDRNLVLLHYVADARVAVFTNYGRFQRWVDLPAAENFGFRAPYLTGSSAEGYWIFDARTKGAGPLVPGKWRGKVVADGRGKFGLDADGNVQYVLNE